MSWPTLTVLALTIRLYDGTALPDSTLTRAVDTAVATLSDAGIASTWLDCSAAVEDGACRQPLEVDGVVLRIRHAALGGAQEVLGDAVVDLGLGAGYFATVYANRVARVAAGARVETGALLGRALAHEVGHLLLGHQRHSTHGLMRANWTAAALSREGPASWRFTPEEGTLMRHQLMRRASLQGPSGRLAAAAVRPFAGPPNAVSPQPGGSSCPPGTGGMPPPDRVRPTSSPAPARFAAPPTTPPPDRGAPSAPVRGAAAGRNG
ncbi:MAG: hypothetical protein AB7I13_09110 [Vicinamibacterales bacterium]